MDKIFISNLTVNAIIGIYDWERETPQEMLINIEVYTDLHLAGSTDSFENCIDYEIIANNVKLRVETTRRLTIEALAEDLAILILADKRIHKVIVRVEKPGVISFVQSVGVVIERSQE